MTDEASSKDIAYVAGLSRELGGPPLSDSSAPGIPPEAESIISSLIDSDDGGFDDDGGSDDPGFAESLSHLDITSAGYSGRPRPSVSNPAPPTVSPYSVAEDMLDITPDPLPLRETIIRLIQEYKRIPKSRRHDATIRTSDGGSVIGVQDDGHNGVVIETTTHAEVR